MKADAALAIQAMVIAHELGHSTEQADVAHGLKIQCNPRLVRLEDKKHYQAQHDEMRLTSIDEDLRIVLGGPLTELGFMDAAVYGRGVQDLVEYARTRSAAEWIAKALKGGCVSESDIIKTLGKPVDSTALHASLVRNYALGMKLSDRVSELIEMRERLNLGETIELDQDGLLEYRDRKGSFQAIFKTIEAEVAA